MIEVSDPKNPTLVSSLDTYGYALEVSIIKMGVKIFALVADDSSGLKIIQVNDP